MCRASRPRYHPPVGERETDVGDDDAVLLDRWRAGDRAAGEALVARHFAAVLRVFRHKVGDVADDLVQQTFLICLERRDDIIAGERFRAYLLRVAYSRLLRFFRERAGPRGRVDPIVSSVHELSPSPSAQLGADDEHTRLVAALARLPLEMQVALELFYWEEMSAPEIAGVLAIPEGTVRSRLRLGRDKLRDQLGELDRAAVDVAEIERRTRAARRS